ncbi:MAG: enoyl-CoA hydratase/isomerase family protein [Pseudomonadota bacterium]
MSYSEFSALKIEVVDHVAWLTIDHPPINLFDMILIAEMDAAGAALAADDDVHVVVLQSADPDFFIAHADVTLIQNIGDTDPIDDPDSSFFHAMTERFRLMPKPTIGKVSGVARGGGLELLAALDMRFCARETSVFAQPEVTVGIIPGGGGSSRWPRLIGYARAMELMLGGADVDAETAEKYGMVNRALPAADLDAFVETLATRMARFSPHATALIKQVGQSQESIEETLYQEHRAFMESARHLAALAAMKQFMENGGQTREVELAGAF